MDWGWGQVIKSTTHRRVENLATVVVRGVLPGLREEELDCCPWSKVLFSDESKFCISFGNQGPRVWRKGGEAHSPSCLKSSVKFLQSVMIWGDVICWCWSIVFFENQRHCPVYQEIWSFMLPSADQLFKDADFIFQQDLTPAHTAKSTKSWLNDHALAANSPDLNIENLWVFQEENETGDQKMQMSWRPLSKKPGLHTTSAVPQTDHLHATPHWGSN